MSSIFISNVIAAGNIPVRINNQPKPSARVQPKVEVEKKEVVAAPVAPVRTMQETLDLGKKLYFSNCISCHNKDPNIKGGIGPEMVDAPLEVMTSKVMTGLYPEKLPPGFVPKRKTKMMKKIVKLQNDIPAIHAYVQSVKKK